MSLKRTRSQIAADASATTATSSAATNKFSSFQPKKFRPRKAPEPKGDEDHPENEEIPVESVAAPPVAVTATPEPLQTAGAITAVVEKSQAGEIRKAATGRADVSFYSSDAPDDATYKTELEVISNFDTSSVFRAAHTFSADARIAVQPLMQDWREAQVVWCYPYPHSSGWDGNSLQRQSEFSRPAADAVCAEWVEAALSATQLFLDNKIDNFVISSQHSLEGSAKSALSANFYVDVDSVTNEEILCCVLTDANVVILKRLQVLAVQFEILLPYSSQAEKLKQESNVKGPQEGIYLSDLGSGVFYKVLVNKKEYLPAVVDVLMENLLINFSDSSSFSGNTRLPQIISTMPFGHSSVCQSNVVSIKSTDKMSNSLTGPEFKTREQQGSAKLQLENGRQCRYRVVLRGFFNVVAIQALAALLAHVARGMFVTESSRKVELDLHPAQFIDSGCFDPAYRKQWKQSKSSFQKLAASSLKDPMRLTTSKRSILLPIVGEPTVSDNGDGAFFFQIVPREFYGIPYLSSLGSDQKRKLCVPDNSAIKQGVLFRELSWVLDQDSYNNSIDKIRPCVEKYRIHVSKDAIVRPVPVVYFCEEKVKLEAKRRADNSLDLGPMNEYSVYAS